jgi:hypothetical protein
VALNLFALSSPWISSKTSSEVHAMLFNHSHHLCLSYFFSLVQLLLFLDFDLAVILGHMGSSQLFLLSTIATLSIVLSTMSFAIYNGHDVSSKTGEEEINRNGCQGNGQ